MSVWKNIFCLLFQCCLDVQFKFILRLNVITKTASQISSLAPLIIKIGILLSEPYNISNQNFSAHILGHKNILLMSSLMILF